MRYVIWVLLVGCAASMLLLVLGGEATRDIGRMMLFDYVQFAMLITAMVLLLGIIAFGFATLVCGGDRFGAVMFAIAGVLVLLACTAVAAAPGEFVREECRRGGYEQVEMFSANHEYYCVNLSRDNGPNMVMVKELLDE